MYICIYKIYTDLGFYFMLAPFLQKDHSNLCANLEV